MLMSEFPTLLIAQLVLLVILNLVLYYYCLEYGTTKDYPIILLWHSGFPERKRIACGKYKCLLSRDRRYLDYTNLGAILFYSSAFDPCDLPLPRSNRIWALYHEESSRNAPWLMHHEAQMLFNVTATFSRHSEFPITFDSVNMEIIETTKYYIPLPVKNKLGIAPILYMQNICENPIQRDSYVLELMEYIEIDCYGSCLNNKPLPHELKILDQIYHNDQEDLMRFMARYKFVLTIENSVCDDYISEKVWKAITVGSIPIYLGSPTIKDWLPNSKTAIVISDFLNPKQLAKYIHSINENDTLYLQYMQHKLSIEEKVTNRRLVKTLLENGNTMLDNKYLCFLCKNIHINRHYKRRHQSIMNCVRHGAISWSKIYRKGICEAIVLDEFINKLDLRNYTREEYSKRVTEMMDKGYC